MSASFQMSTGLYFNDNFIMAPPARLTTPSGEQFLTLETNVSHSKPCSRHTKDMWPLAFYGSNADSQSRQGLQKSCSESSLNRSPVVDVQSQPVTPMSPQTPRKRYHRARRHDSAVHNAYSQARPVDEFEGWYTNQTSPSTASSVCIMTNGTIASPNQIARDTNDQASNPCTSSSPRWYKAPPYNSISPYSRIVTPTNSPPRIASDSENDFFPIVTPTKPHLNPYVFDTGPVAQTRTRSSSALRSPSPFSSPSGSHEPSQLSLDLPLPDFIAPRPAMRQRYVSAGGTAKLRDRPEIQGFPLPPAIPHNAMQLPGHQDPPSWPSSFNNAENPTITHGNDTFLMMSPKPHYMDLDPPACISAWDSSPNSKQRGSTESTEKMMQMFRGEKRGRTASSASMRERIKRVFSRKASEVFDTGLSSSQDSHQGLNGVYS